MKDDEKIIAFPGAVPVPENPLRVNERRDVYCSHERIVLDDHERVVRCADCSKVFDPFTFLRDQAGLIQRAWASHKHVLAMVREKMDTVVLLKAEEKRLRAAVARHKAKQDTVNLRSPD